MFKNPFSFEGRIRRLEYGLTFVIYIVIYVLALGLMAAAGQVGPFIFMIVFIPMIWFAWAQGAKRCHDLGKSGWWQLIPFYGIIMLFLDGEPGVNEYGSNPKNPDQVGTMDSETLDGHLRQNS